MIVTPTGPRSVDLPIVTDNASAYYELTCLSFLLFRLLSSFNTEAVTSSKIRLSAGLLFFRLYFEVKALHIHFPLFYDPML